MRNDKPFFEHLASFSEFTLLSAIAELAVKKDLESLSVFIDFMKTTSTPLPALHKNERFRVSHKDPKAVHLAHGIPKASDECGVVEFLMLALSHDLHTKDSSALPKQPLDDRQLAYLDSIVDLAEFVKEKVVWRHAILEGIARGTNDPAVLGHLSLEHYNAAAKTKGYSSKSNTYVERTVASEALIFGNVALATAMFKTMSGDKITGLEPEHQINKDLSEQHVRSLAKGIVQEPQSVLDVLAVWSEKAPQKTENMRALVFMEALQNSRQDHLRVDPTTLINILGSGVDEIEKFRRSLWDRHNGLAIARTIIRNHLVEAMPLVADMAQIGKHSERNTKRLGIHDAISSASAHVGDSASEARLKATLEILIQYGYTLDNVTDDDGALKYLATNGRKDDVARKLHVLLELGADPQQKDSRNWVPSSHAGQRMPEQKQAWLHVERSFKARHKSLSLLDKMDLENAPSGANEKPSP